MLEETKTLSRWKPLLIGCAAVFGLEVLYGVVVVRVMGHPDTPGIFGDMFGGLNTLFAGLALGGVVYTIYLQMKESAEAREEQIKAQRLVQAQVAALEEGLERQRRRDKVEAGPFFELNGHKNDSGGLQLQLINVGAPVICLGFKCMTQGCSVGNRWGPSALANGEMFTAQTQVPPNLPSRMTYEMRLQDRWGERRTFEIVLNGDQLVFEEIANMSNSSLS